MLSCSNSCGLAAGYPDSKIVWVQVVRNKFQLAPGSTLELELGNTHHPCYRGYLADADAVRVHNKDLALDNMVLVLEHNIEQVQELVHNKVAVRVHNKVAVQVHSRQFAQALGQVQKLRGRELRTESESDSARKQRLQVHSKDYVLTDLNGFQVTGHQRNWQPTSC